MCKDGTCEHHQPNDHQHGHGSVNRMAASATLHCLTGCSIGEVLGLIIGSIANLPTVTTVALSVTLAFIFGFALSIVPLVRAGVARGRALRTVLAADTLSIATMEVVNNGLMVVIPGAMGHGLVNPIFWFAMPFSLAVAYVFAYPVNKYLISRGKGHTLTMNELGGHHDSAH